nr:hypothetical protein CFP56_48817 [Quercus suber]
MRVDEQKLYTSYRIAFKPHVDSTGLMEEWPRPAVRDNESLFAVDEEKKGSIHYTDEIHPVQPRPSGLAKEDLRASVGPLWLAGRDVLRRFEYSRASTPPLSRLEN